MIELSENEIWGYWKPTQSKAQLIKSSTEIRAAKGHMVQSYMELATKVAELQFRNRNLVLMFRGQNGDHPNVQKRTTLKASLFRSVAGTRIPPDSNVLRVRYAKLKRAEEELVRLYIQARLLGKDRLKRYRLLRWAILQHYEVCRTPLLDVTHSLRIAASFATMPGKPADPPPDTAYLFVLGVPNLAGAITASAEAGLQIIRLASVCPPDALRPHFQEGYLLGDYPELLDYDHKQELEHHEVDFGRRLLAKFQFPTAALWADPNFPPAPPIALYPTSNEDLLLNIAQQIKATIGMCP